jgi:hypothetical protein
MDQTLNIPRDQILPDDLEIIMAFQEDLKLIDGYLSKYDDKTCIINHEKLFLIDSETFENNIDRYLDHISNNDAQLWIHLSDTLPNTELSSFICQFVDHMYESEYDTQTFINILTKLLLSSNYCKLHPEVKGKIFTSLIKTIDPDNWDNEIIATYIFFDSINILEIFVDWAMVIENQYIKKMNIDLNSGYISEPSDIVICNIIGILLNAWRFSSFVDNDKIDPSYINSKKCPIRWENKIYNTTTNIRTKLFFSIFNALRVGIIPIYYRYQTFTKDIEIMDAEILKHKGLMRHVLIDKRNIIKKYIDDTTIIVNIKSLANLINNFYNTTYEVLQIMKINHGMVIDDILNAMSYYMTFDDCILLEIDNGYCEFVVDILHSKNITNSISIKYDFIEVVYELLKLNKLEINITIKFAESLIMLHNDVHQTDMSLDQKIKKKIMIYSCIHDTLQLNNINFKDICVDVMKKNINVTKKMFHIILVSLSDINDEIVNIYKEKEKTLNSKLNLEKGIYNIMNTFYLPILSFLSSVIRIMYDNKDLMKVLLSTEIFSSFITMINKNVNYLSNVIEYRSDMNFKGYTQANLNIENYVKYIINFLNIINQNTDMSKFTHDYTFNMDSYKKLQTHINNPQYNEIFENLECENVDEEIDYPDEFLDPLTCTKIDEPCLIPGMNGFDDIYFDKSTILRQLLIKEENPYTRSPLTLEEFEKYNELDEIVQKNKLFKEKMINYK